MNLIRRRAFLVLCVTLPELLLAQDCVYKECSCIDTSVVCQARGLTSIPTMVPTITHFTSLNLDMNAIMAIPAESLPPNLTVLELDVNPISVIEDTAFDGSANTLQTLVFSLALFERIPDAFLHLKALTTLTIHDTKINDWNEEAMKNIGRTVTSLELQNVGMSVWPTWIQYFSKLTELTLAEGSISAIPEDALDNVTDSLQSLSLYRNSLTEVPKALSKLTALQSLFMKENKITNVTWLPQASKLSALWLSNNQISDAKLLSQALRPYGDFLTDLDIDINLLTAIPDFPFLTQIEDLDFSYNRISDPLSGSVPSALPSIDLSHNSLSAVPVIMPTLDVVTDLVLHSNVIKEIHGTDFPPSTMKVDLGYNLISALSDTSFPEFSQIESVDFSNNPLERISIMAFENLHRLTELNLQNTRLTRLPLALRYLSSLSMFDMTDSTDLVCTCMETELGRLFLPMSPANVLGNCGKLSIYDFFSKLSPDCPSEVDTDT